MYLAIVAVLFESQSWVLSLIVHFQHWMILVGLVLIIFSPWMKKKKTLFFILSLISTVILAFIIAPHWRPTFNLDVSENNVEALDVFYANVNSQNDSKEQLITYLKNKKPKIVFLVEINNAWAKQLKQIEDIYPYSKMILRDGNFGLGVLSRFPLEVKDIFVDRENMIPALLLKSKSPMGQINLAILHAFPPIGSYGSLLRDQYLITLARHFQEIQEPLLVCGDFNTTPWSHIFTEFLEISKLDKAPSTPNTWPSNILLPSIPIDHCLSRNLKIIEYKKGPPINSDHHPLTLKITHR